MATRNYYAMADIDVPDEIRWDIGGMDSVHVFRTRRERDAWVRRRSHDFTLKRPDDQTVTRLLRAPDSIALYLHAPVRKDDLPASIRRSVEAHMGLDYKDMFPTDGDDVTVYWT